VRFGRVEPARAGADVGIRPQARRSSWSARAKYIVARGVTSGVGAKPGGGVNRKGRLARASARTTWLP
jgi:hypothetical protein